jgi:hypothetical protein
MSRCGELISDFLSIGVPQGTQIAMKNVGTFVGNLLQKSGKS